MSNELNELPAEVGPSAELVGGRYRLLGVIGAGNMGEVHRAVHHITGQVVALKLLQGHVVRGRGGVVRFLREVRAASTVGHPGVVPVFDAGSHLDTLYIAMELLEGQAFRDRLQALRTAQDPGTAAVGLAVVRAALEPLAAAHAAGIVHRDFKPDNVFLQRLPDGGEAVRLLDFGIASDQHDGSATQTGFTVGTPFYMSPEQAMDPRTCTAASDVWSVGAVLYEVLTGQVPFDGATAHAVCMSAVRDPHPPLFQAAPGIDPRLAALVDRCLSKTAAQRPADARALATALDAIGLTLPAGGTAQSAARSAVNLGTAALGSGTGARAASSAPLQSAPGSWSGPLSDLPGTARSARARWMMVGAGAVVALGLGLGVAYLNRSPSPREGAAGTEASPVQAPARPTAAGQAVTATGQAVTATGQAVTASAPGEAGSAVVTAPSTAAPGPAALDPVPAAALDPAPAGAPAIGSTGTPSEPPEGRTTTPAEPAQGDTSGARRGSVGAGRSRPVVGSGRRTAPASAAPAGGARDVPIEHRTAEGSTEPTERPEPEPRDEPEPRAEPEPPARPEPRGEPEPPVAGLPPPPAATPSQPAPRPPTESTSAGTTPPVIGAAAPRPLERRPPVAAPPSEPTAPPLTF